MIETLNKEQLKNIDGGSISGTLISAFTSGIKAIFDIGKSLGNSIRRITEGKLCEVL